MMMKNIAIAKIKIKRRFRKEMGDIDALAKSIENLGLLHPPVVLEDYTLIAGQRRIKAFQQLKRKTIPVTITKSLDEALKLIEAQSDENTCREDFRPLEVVALSDVLAPMYEKEAAQRLAEARAAQGARGKEGGRGKKKTLEGKLPARVKEQRVRDKLAAATGFKASTLERARKVARKAEESPEVFGPIAEKMNETRNVNAAYRKVKQSEDETRILQIKPVEGKFRTLIIDPPWDHEGLSLAGRGAPLYAVMSQEELLAMNLAQWAEDDCHLYLWTTNNFILRAGALIEPWGFKFKTMLTWVKPRFGLGSYFRSSTEHVLFAVRGENGTRADNIPTHFMAPLGEHSAKPQEFYDIAMRASYEPFGEIFQRTPREKITNVLSDQPAKEAA